MSAVYLLVFISIYLFLYCININFYLQKILTEVTVDEPCIILPDEVSMDDLKLLIDFVYRGEIKFLISQIASLSKLAQMLGIPGLPGFTEVVRT
jgi:BTB/POZ domain